VSLPIWFHPCQYVRLVGFRIRPLTMGYAGISPEELLEVYSSPRFGPSASCLCCYCHPWGCDDYACHCRMRAE
jgi:hypothetical protein